MADKAKLRDRAKSLSAYNLKHIGVLLFASNAAGLIMLTVQLAIARWWAALLIALLIIPVPFVLYFSCNFMIPPDTGKETKRKRTLQSYARSWGWSSVMLMNTLLFAVIPTHFGSVNGIAVRRVICIVVDIVFLLIFLFVLSRPLNKVKMQPLGEVNLPQKMGIALFSEEKKPGDVVLCKNKDTGAEVILPRKDRFLHMLVLGPTGSGKTSQIILPMLYQDMQNINAGITVIEPKGDLAEKAYAMAEYFGREALYFNPVLESCPTFNPLYGNETDVIENIVTAFKMLDPDSAQFFQDMNEQLLRNSLKMLKRLYGNDATLIQLSRLITNSGNFYREASTAFRKAAPNEAIRAENEDILNYFADYFDPKKTKTFENTSGVRSQIAKIVSNKYLRRVLNPEKGRGSDIDFDSHLERGTVICISTAQGSLRDLGRFLGYFIILNFQSSTFRRPGNENTRRDHFLYIDEFQSYSNPGFADMLTQGRSYRVASHLATQNRALIGMGSGRDGDDFVELVSTNARNIVVFPGCNANDAKYYSDQFGEIDTVTIGTSSSMAAPNPLAVGAMGPQKDTYSLKEDTEARLSPTDISQRPFGEITYAIIKNNSVQPADIGKISYIDKKVNDLLDRMVYENHVIMSMNINPSDVRDLSQQGQLIPKFRFDWLERDYEERQKVIKEDSVRIINEETPKSVPYMEGPDGQPLTPSESKIDEAQPAVPADAPSVFKTVDDDKDEASEKDEGPVSSVVIEEPQQPDGSDAGGETNSGADSDDDDLI